jgi:hypothetical protein
MGALVTSSVQPRKLELAVALRNHQVFRTYQSEDSVFDIFRNVETLCLLDSYNPRYLFSEGNLEESKLFEIVIAKKHSLLIARCQLTIFAIILVSRAILETRLCPPT